MRIGCQPPPASLSAARSPGIADLQLSSSQHGHNGGRLAAPLQHHPRLQRSRTELGSTTSSGSRSCRDLDALAGAVFPEEEALRCGVLIAFSRRFTLILQASARGQLRLPRFPQRGSGRWPGCWRRSLRADRSDPCSWRIEHGQDPGRVGATLFSAEFRRDRLVWRLARAWALVVLEGQVLLALGEAQRSHTGEPRPSRPAHGAAHEPLGAGATGSRSSWHAPSISSLNPAASAPAHRYSTSASRRSTTAGARPAAARAGEILRILHGRGHGGQLRARRHPRRPPGRQRQSR